MKHLTLLTLLVCALCSLIAFIHAQSNTQKSSNKNKLPPGLDTYYGTWKHVSIPKSIRRPETNSNLNIDNNNNKKCSSTDGDANCDSSSSSTSTSTTVVQTGFEKSENQQKPLFQSSFEETVENLQKYLKEPNSFDLDFEIADVASLINISASGRMRMNVIQQKSSSKTQFTFVPSNNDESSPCSVRLISRSAENNNDKEIPHALEVTCDRLAPVLRKAVDHYNTLNSNLFQQQQQDNSNNKKKKKRVREPDFDPTIPPFRFLNYDEASVYWPIARVSALLLSSQQQQQQKRERWFEGSNSACIETEASLAVQYHHHHHHHVNNNKTEKPESPKNHLTKIALLVPLSLSSEQTSPITVDQILSQKESPLLSIRIRMIPLYSTNNPTSRQLVRWLKWAPPAEDLLQKADRAALSEDDVAELDFQNEKKRLDQLRNETNVMFELRTTEKRMTRVGLGFRARLRRNDSRFSSEEEKLRAHRKSKHLPIYTNWSIEIVRRVPRPQLECVVVFSRLLDFPEMFDHVVHDVEGDDIIDKENNNKKNKTQKSKLVDDDDPFEDEDDADEVPPYNKNEEDDDAGLSDEELKLKRRRERVRKLLSKKDSKVLPTEEQIENARMHLVGAHQLRGVLDSQYSLPEFSRFSPVISVPAGPSPNLLESEADILATRKHPPQGLYVLYVSEERPREQIVDVEIDQADYHFVAPLKVEKKVLEITLHGEYEKLPLPRPPVTNWTWFDINNVPLVASQQVTQHRKLDPRLAAQVNSPEAIFEQQMLDSRGTLPKLLFHYHNHSLFPGFSVLIEQNRPIDDLQIWIRDGKNDTLFLDEENFVPFSLTTVHQHDPVDSPLFGWRLALDSQRLIALDKLYISFSFKYRRSDDFFSNSPAIASEPTTNDYLNAYSQFTRGKEAAKHLISWVEDHRWIPLSERNAKVNMPKSGPTTDDSIKNPQGLPLFASFLPFQRRFGTASPRNPLIESASAISTSTLPPKLFESILLEKDTKQAEGIWRLLANKELQPGEDIFTLPWSACLRHSQAPNWILDLVTSKDFETEVLERHEQFLLANDHVDLLSKDEEEKESNEQEGSNDNAYIKRIKDSIRQRRRIAFDNAKAWTILTLMHWAQVEPEMVVAGNNANAHAKWGSETIATRWHAHYRMFNERIKTDPARKLRKFILSRIKNGLSLEEERRDIPSASWSPLAESIAQRNNFLTSAAKYFIKMHPGLPQTFFANPSTAAASNAQKQDQPISYDDWFVSAYTIIEARSLLISSSQPGVPSEWIYIPLLDFATPSSNSDSNIDLSFTRATLLQTHLALKVSVKKDKKIAKGTPLSFSGWSGGGFRTATHGLELFGYLSDQQMMDFTPTVTPLLPFGPILQAGSADVIASSRRAVLDECKARCKRVSEGRTVSMMHDDGLPIIVRDQQQQDNNNDDDSRSISAGSLLPEEQQRQNHNQDSSSNSCCGLQWLDAKLRRRWKQITANELLWNVGRDTVKKLMLSVGKIPKEIPPNQNFVAAPREEEPPLWKVSRQHLISSSRKVLEQHILAIAEEMDKRNLERLPALKSMKTKLSSLNNRELVEIVFGSEDVENENLRKDAPIESYIEEENYMVDEMKWFSCCQKKNADDNLEEDEVEMK